MPPDSYDSYANIDITALPPTDYEDLTTYEFVPGTYLTRGATPLSSFVTATGLPGTPNCYMRRSWTNPAGSEHLGWFDIRFKLTVAAMANTAECGLMMVTNDPAHVSGNEANAHCTVNPAPPPPYNCADWNAGCKMRIRYILVGSTYQLYFGMWNNSEHSYLGWGSTAGDCPVFNTPYWIRFYHWWNGWTGTTGQYVFQVFASEADMDAGTPTLASKSMNTIYEPNTQRYNYFLPVVNNGSGALTSSFTVEDVHIFSPG
jgi:hypothetical protein